MGKKNLGRAHEALRRATAAAHHELDHHPLLQRLMGAELTRDNYAQALAAMYWPHARLEQQVHGSRHLFKSGLKLTARVGLLEADLRELGRPVPPGSALAADWVEERAVWWGRVYVLEGSRKGGVVIARHIQSRLGNTVPCHFFGEAAVADDSHVLQAMRERELAADSDLEKAVRSAQAALAAYKHELGALTYAGHT